MMNGNADRQAAHHGMVSTQPFPSYAYGPCNRTWIGELRSQIATSVKLDNLLGIPFDVVALRTVHEHTLALLTELPGGRDREFSIVAREWYPLRPDRGSLSDEVLNEWAIRLQIQIQARGC